MKILRPMLEGLFGFECGVGVFSICFAPSYWFANGASVFLERVLFSPPKLYLYVAGYAIKGGRDEAHSFSLVMLYSYVQLCFYHGEFEL